MQAQKHCESCRWSAGAGAPIFYLPPPPRVPLPAAATAAQINQLLHPVSALVRALLLFLLPLIFLLSPRAPRFVFVVMLIIIAGRGRTGMLSLCSSAALARSLSRHVFTIRARALQSTVVDEAVHLPSQAMRFALLRRASPHLGNFG